MSLLDHPLFGGLAHFHLGLQTAQGSTDGAEVTKMKLPNYDFSPAVVQELCFEDLMAHLKRGRLTSDKLVAALPLPKLNAAQLLQLQQTLEAEGNFYQQEAVEEYTSGESFRAIGCAATGNGYLKVAKKIAASLKVLAHD